MAFLNLRNNHQIYILRKNAIPTLETGKVISVSLPVPKYGTPGMYNDMVIDITVDINGNATSFLKLPANSEIADFGNDLVLACNKEAMNSEVISMKLRSLDIINSVELHKGIVEGCDQILQVINPEIAEKLRLELENKALREEINSLKEMFSLYIQQSLKQKQNGDNN